MTQPIDPTQWPLVEGRYPETGTYFRVKSNGETWAGFFQKDGLILTSNGDGFGIETYGPIAFATEKNMAQVIDLSHFDLSKIEPKKQPDKPGVYWVSGGGDDAPGDFGLMSLSQEELDSDTCDFSHTEYRYLCDFIPPKQSPVIPPKPENVLHLMRLTEVICETDGVIGDLEWCVKNRAGNFYIVNSDGIKTGNWWNARQCEPMTE